MALERLSLALAATGLGIWERDLATGRIVWSETMHEIYGRTPEEFTGTPEQVLSFVHPDDRAQFRRMFEAAVEGDAESFQHEYRIVRRDGEVRWVQRRAQVRRGPDGRARSILGVALDITERKRAEEANARLAAIVSAAEDAIMGLAADGTVTAWNPAAERMFGYAAEEMIGKSARVLYPDGAEDEFDNNYRQVRAGENFTAEGVRKTRDGTTLDVAASFAPVLGAGGQVVGVSAVVRNITERKLIEQKLVETLALLLQTNNQHKLALIAGRMGTFEVDIERDTVSWSDEIYEQVGISRDAAIMTLADGEKYLHPEDREAVRASREAAFQSGGAYESEFRIVRPSGEIRWLYVRALPLGNGGRPARVYGVSMDVTDRKEREAHIRVLMSEVSHRSKNLLAVVQAIATQTASTTQEPRDFATSFGARLKSLASSLDLLVQQDWRGVSTRELVQSQLGHMAGRVTIEGPDVLLGASAAQYLGMALHELSTNAVKYGALSVPDGKVAIEWRLSGRRAAQQFHISWIESGGPPVSPPQEKGFGHLVIERMVAEALQGNVRLEFERDGLRWLLDADAAATIKQGEPDPAPGQKKNSPVHGERARGD